MKLIQGMMLYPTESLRKELLNLDEKYGWSKRAIEEFVSQKTFLLMDVNINGFGCIKGIEDELFTYVSQNVIEDMRKAYIAHRVIRFLQYS